MSGDVQPKTTTQVYSDVLKEFCVSEELCPRLSKIFRSGLVQQPILFPYSLPFYMTMLRERQEVSQASCDPLVCAALYAVGVVVLPRLHAAFLDWMSWVSLFFWVFPFSLPLYSCGQAIIVLCDCHEKNFLSRQYLYGPAFFLSHASTLSSSS